MADKDNSELRLWWIIGILISLIVALVSYSTHRETGRLDTQIMVLHGRINDLMKIKADKEDVQREFNYVWRVMDAKEKNNVYPKSLYDRGIDPAVPFQRPPLGQWQTLVDVR